MGLQRPRSQHNRRGQQIRGMMTEFHRPPGAILRSVGAVLLIAGTACLVGCSPKHEQGAPATETSRAQQPKLTTITPAMMVGREAFPADAVGNWRAPYIYDESSGGSDQGCAPLSARWERVGNSHIVASLDATAEVRRLRYRVDLIMPKNGDHPDIGSVVEACSTLEQNGHSLRIQKESVSGIPSWATAYTVNASGTGDRSSVSVIAGHYRGIDIDVAASRNETSSVAGDMPVLTKLFNDQVAKLASQP